MRCRFEESRSALLHALSVAPELSAAQRNLARVEIASGDFEAARARLHDILSKLPDDPRTVAVLAQLKQAEQDVAQPPMDDSPQQGR
jgi:thioredoxin-like negative regulator of GroEL